MSHKLLFVFFCVFSSLRLTVAQVDFDSAGLGNNRTSFSSWSQTGNAWKHIEGLSEPLDGVQPTPTAMADLQVKWQPVTIDSLGEFATIRGQLISLDGESGESSPIDWQQGVTVAVSRKKSQGQNASRQFLLTSDKAVTETCVTNGKGVFVVQVRLAELKREKKAEGQFACSLALAAHSQRPGLGPIIVWSSSDTPLEHSAVHLTFPANPQIDPVVEAVRLACEEDFNPRSMILAVNALQPLGKEAALLRIEEFLLARENANPYSPDADGLFWILRLLFEPIELDRRIPPPMAFVRTVDSSVEPNWPLNPLMVISDIPFRFIGGGIAGSGMPEEPRSHIEFVRRFCVIRDSALRPSRDPVLIAQQLIESPLVYKMPEFDREHAVSDIRTQAIMLVPKSRLANLPDTTDESYWNAVLGKSRASPLVWHPGKGFQETND